MTAGCWNYMLPDALLDQSALVRSSKAVDARAHCGSATVMLACLGGCRSMSRRNWILEVYRTGGGGDHLATLEFATLPLLRVALTEHLGKKFFVTMPNNVTAEDRNTLLDLRAQGFDIAIRM